MTRTIFGKLFEDTKITTRLPKRHICNTTEINTLFAICNNKELGNYTMLKEMDAGL